MGIKTYFVLASINIAILLAMSVAAFCAGYHKQGVVALLFAAANACIFWWV